MKRCCTWISSAPPIFYNDGKYNRKNISIFIFISAYGLFFYLFPKLFISFIRWFEIENSNEYFIHLTTNIHYFHAIQYISTLTYWVIVLLTLLIWLVAKTSSGVNAKLHALETNSNAANFARAVNLMGGSRFSSQAEKDEMIELITKKFDESATIKVMMVNWHDDVIPPISPILHALVRNCQKDIKILLLDPFSTFAKQRAETLADEGDNEANWHSYIRMYNKVVCKLDHTNQDHSGNISHFVFCSRPFFRFYLFDRDIFIQVYHNNNHGCDSPMFHYQKSEGGSIKNDSMFQLGVEMFEYYLKNSFQFDADKLKGKGDPFAVYLAKMYGILKESDVKNPDGLRDNILKFVRNESSKADQKRNSYKPTESTRKFLPRN